MVELKTPSYTVYDGNQIVLQIEAEGQVTNRYLWGPAVDQILADEQVQFDGSSAVLWTLTDHLNTVRDLAVQDAETGVTSIANHLVYDAFGRVTSQTDPAVGTLFGFTARPFDRDTGLQNNLNRWYDAETGTWISEDPKGFAAADANLYRYVGNEVTMASDPSGLQEAYSPPPFSPTCAALFGGLTGLCQAGQYLTYPLRPCIPIDWKSRDEALDTAWKWSGLDGTTTQTLTRGAAGTGAAATYAAGALYVIEYGASQGMFRVTAHGAERMAERSIHRSMLQDAIAYGSRTTATESQKGVLSNVVNYLTKTGHEILATKNGSDGVLFVVRNQWTNRIITVYFRSF